jgi:hypothetical protein
MAYCSQCGAQFLEEARFCVGCGHARSQPTAASGQPGSDSATGYDRQAERVQAQPPQVVVTATKSLGIAILLTALFGPLGMFYSTIPGAITMLIVSLVIGLVTFGFGLFLTWPVCVIWGAMAAKAYNEKLLAGERRY